MRDYGPKPLVEEHYHIQELIEAQEKRVADRQYHKDRLKELEERESLISDSKMITQTDFYCDTCKKDFKSQAVRQVEVDWSNSLQRIAYYKTKCWKGHWVIRFITDKNRDGFWQRSRFVALDRGNHFASILQPFEIGYQLMFGKK